MSNFGRVRLLWSQLSALNADEVEQFDTELTQTINAYGGSTHAPLAPIVIGQGAGNVTAGLWVTGHAILDNFEGHVNSGYAITLDSGSALVASGGAGIDVANGGAINVTDGASLIMGADFGAGGSSLVVNGRAFFNGDSHTLIQGTSGHDATVLFGHNSACDFQGTAGNEALVNFDSHSRPSFVGCAVTDSGVWTRSGAETWQGGAAVTFTGAATISFTGNAGMEFHVASELYLDSGMDFQQRCTNNRTGADVPSGAGAVSCMRLPVTGPNTSTNIDISAQDVLHIPTGIAVDIAWGLTPPSKPCRCTIVSPSTVAQGASVGIVYTSSVIGSVTLAVFGHSVAKQGSVEIVFDGTFFFAIGKEGPDVT